MLDEQKSSQMLKNINSKICTYEPFNDKTCEFLNEVSSDLLKNKKNYPEIVSFAFWCRKSNINVLKKKYLDNSFRLGRGVVFHITPKNVAINFAYSFAFGLLSGNSNIVRVAQKNPVNKIIINSFNKIFNKKKFNSLKKSNKFIFYNKNSKITEIISKFCDARIIWGGDNTVNRIKQIPTKPRCVDISFSDRYSLSIIHLNEKSNLNKITAGFFNDSYTMGQNACSSPHIIIWYRTKQKFIEKYWNKIYLLSKNKFILNNELAIKKYLNQCENLINYQNIKFKKNYDNYLYVSNLKNINSNLEKIRGMYGTFYQIKKNNFLFLKKIINNKYQTITYSGISKKTLKENIINQNLKGIDRIVPVGKALDIDIKWDGYDLVHYLTRVINIV